MFKSIFRKLKLTQLYHYTFDFLSNKVTLLYSILCSKNKIEDYILHNEVRKLHIGCGTNLIEGWLNTDLYPRNLNAVRLNAFKMSAIPNNSFDYIFSEHMIEHLTYQQGEIMLKECKRILKPNGKIRIATPNLQFLLNLMNPEKSKVQIDYIKFITQKDIKSEIESDCFVLNNFFYNYTHRFIYDKNTLSNLLKNVGFNKINFYNPSNSLDPNLTNIEHHGHIIGKEFNELESMVVEASF